MAKKMFYKPKGTVYNVMVGVHVSVEMKARLERAVERAGVTQSEFLRQVIEQALRDKEADKGLNSA